MTITETTIAVPALQAAELYERLLHDPTLFILDVRNPDDFRRWRVEGRAGLESLNIPYYEFLEDEDGAIARLPRGREVLVVCAKEGSSQYIAELLQQRGNKAAYLQGGIMSWGNYYHVRPIVTTADGQLVQVARPARGDVSFVIISAGQATIIDPLRHTSHYLEIVREAGATLTAIFDTHVHADHISGGPALAQATGAPYYVHAYDAIHPIDMLPARIAYTTLEDGQVFRIGQLTLTALWFPGHTLGQMNFRLTAPDGASYLFTGDGIFLRSFGRPDLGGKGETWTPLLYESIYQRLPRYVDDTTLILPAHFSDLDEGGADGRFAMPYSALLQTNDGLAPRTLAQFTTYVLGNLPVFPPQYVEIKRVNIGLATPDEAQADELELGKNICALSH
ncbi:MAG: MBL fold metallo-hydrolase [Chloroflexaceae bacterium]|jgi:glyoxylase-like metal-dependent hydrolase (beta-lactamase superfamily II)|nr:MBL fold metallo-hydrolase [Chloroflexaceae bacterium]